MKYYQPKEIAEMYGVSISYIREGCARAAEFHPIPHLDVGTGKRHCPRIRQEPFERWLDEEEAMTRVDDEVDR